MDNIIGIDPGLAGGIAILNKQGKIQDVMSMPVLYLKTAKGRKGEYDVKKIREMFEEYSPKMVALEIQQAMPKQGVTSTFKTGRGFGLLEGILIGLKIPYILIKPRQWQSTMFEGLPKDNSKTLSILVAERLFPEQDFRKSDRCSNVSDGMTDAILIAEYARRETK